MKHKIDEPALINRIESLIDLGSVSLDALSQGKQPGSDPLASFYEFKPAALSFILTIYDKDHPYYESFSSITFRPDNLHAGMGILKAIKGEIAQGWLRNTIGLISADIFGDFMEMAQHLLDEGYKDPAAVLAGSSLEKHMKNICPIYDIETYDIKHGKHIPKKASRLNSELYTKQAYSKIDEKSITQWLSVRNDAAHGNYDNYTNQQVQLMLDGIAEFIPRTTR